VAKRLLRYEGLSTKGIFYSKTQLWRLEKRGQFPRRVPIGPGRHGWVEEEIDQFIADRIAARDAANLREARAESKKPRRSPIARFCRNPQIGEGRYDEEEIPILRSRLDEG
jgi:prophage regulatory protein